MSIFGHGEDGDGFSGPSAALSAAAGLIGVSLPLCSTPHPSDASSMSGRAKPRRDKTGATPQFHISRHVRPLSACQFRGTGQWGKCEGCGWIAGQVPPDLPAADSRGSDGGHKGLSKRACSSPFGVRVLPFRQNAARPFWGSRRQGGGDVSNPDLPPASFFDHAQDPEAPSLTGKWRTIWLREAADRAADA